MNAPRRAAVIVALLGASLPGMSLPGSLASAAPPPLQELRFGTTADYPPFALHDAAGRLTGADIEAARRIAARLGLRAQFVPTTWTTLAADLRAGRFDVLLGGITVTPERAALGRYSIVLLRDGKRPLVRCEDRDRYTTPASIDRGDVRVMINRGPGMPAVAQRLFPNAALTVNRDDATLIPFLLERRVDVWITDGVVVDHMARRHAGQLCAARVAPYAGTEVEKAWLIRGDAGLLQRLDAELAAELASGRWQRDLEAVP